MDTEDIFAEGRSPHFEEFADRIGNITATDIEQEEFYMRLMQRFCINVYENKPIEPWILRAFADAFAKILMGGDWEDEIYLPWKSMSTIWSRAEERNLKIYCEIENTINDALKESQVQKPQITKLIADAADKHNCSYEIARDAYYKLKKSLS
ncbi:hypothetical protein [Methylobacter sp. BBA5.1]|uniref:hypothetical protein n=1 Tax=Methylobacter sp. BBA5.1 TaxID=1495064 RepID=UPI00056276F6|nr:hypothetical protein [Methylobacter sp. BBA5.1]